jgi:hypothetical protein
MANAGSVRGGEGLFGEKYADQGDYRPCNLRTAFLTIVENAVAAGKPPHLNDTEPAQQGPSSAVPSNPNSRWGVMLRAAQHDGAGSIRSVASAVS